MLLGAAKHDEGVYRLHSLTCRQYHERIDVQPAKSALKVLGEVRNTHQSILERLEVRRWTSTKALELDAVGPYGNAQKSMTAPEDRRRPNVAKGATVRARGRHR